MEIVNVMMCRTVSVTAIHVSISVVVAVPMVRWTIVEPPNVVVRVDRTVASLLVEYNQTNA